VSFAAITLSVASQRLTPMLSVYFVIDSVRKLLDTPSPCPAPLHAFMACTHGTYLPVANSHVHRFKIPGHLPYLSAHHYALRPNGKGLFFVFWSCKLQIETEIPAIMRYSWLSQSLHSSSGVLQSVKRNQTVISKRCNVTAVSYYYKTVILLEIQIYM
jgi:hypothetical protein